MSTTLRVIDEKNPACRVCGSDDVRALAKSFVPRKNALVVNYQCRNCGSFFRAGAFMKKQFPRAIILGAIQMARKGAGAEEIASWAEQSTGIPLSPFTVCNWVLELAPDVDYASEVAESKKAYYQAHRDEIAESQKAYYQAHRDEIAESQKAYYQAHRDEIAESKKAYRQAHRDEIAESQKAYRQAHRDEIAESQKAYYQAHRDEIAESKKAYYQAHRDEIAESKKAYRQARAASRPSRRVTYPCTCGRSFPSKKALREHRWELHAL